MGSNLFKIVIVFESSNFTAEKANANYLNSIAQRLETHFKFPSDFELVQYIKTHFNLI